MGTVEMISREYQIQLEDESIKNNSIIYLPTGSGKTFIALKVIKRMQRDTVAPFSLGGKRTFFLVNTITLVYQHVNVIQNLSSLSVKGFSSQDKVDFWDQNQWNAQLEDTQVLVMTSQILLDMLLHGYISLNQINLLIFDECHSAVENHPMRQIMMKFENVPQETAPRVVGLTATLLNKNITPAKVEETIRDLETTFHAKICTTSSLDDVMRFSTNPREIIINFDEVPPEWDVIKILQKNLNDHFEILKYTTIKKVPTTPSVLSGFHGMTENVTIMKKLTRLHDKIIENISQFGILGTSLFFTVVTIRLERLKLQAPEESQIYYQSFISVCTKCKAIVESYMAKYSDAEKIKKFLSPKVQALLKILKEYSLTSSPQHEPKTINTQEEKLCGIVFVKERSTAHLLYLVLKRVAEIDPTFDFLSHDFIVGFNSNPLNDTRESLYEKKINKLTVTKFHTGVLNCLISTDILEEGFDLPQCNIVVRFDEAITFRSYVQSKGRGRHSNATFIMLVTKNKINKFRVKWDNFSQVDTKLKEVLIGKSQYRPLPSEEELSKLYDARYESYVFKNATVTVNSSISLLNRYCQTLPHDLFTVPTPQWFYAKDDCRFIVTVILPFNCPVKKFIQSPPVDNLKMGKQIVALEVCKELHAIGELNDDLLPADRIEEIMVDTKSFFSHWDLSESKDNKEKYFTYSKVFPKCYTGSSDKHKHFYIYKINIQPTTESDVCNIFGGSHEGYGILVLHEIPQICPFTLFNRFGELIISLDRLPDRFEITSDELDSIKRFQLFLFLDVLEVDQSFACYRELSKKYYFIIPMKSSNVDWKSIMKYTELEDLGPPSVNERRNMVVKPEDYIHRIVSPWYRIDHDCRYFVTEVCTNMTPNSPFPDDSTKNFSEYFRKKYDVSTENLNQPLLKVKHVGGKMNCLLPRATSFNIEGVMSKRKLQLLGDEVLTLEYLLLVPELCVKFSFPGALWLKATLLPSILHRISYLILADELRQKICTETGLGCVHVPTGIQLPILKVDFHVFQKYQKSLIKPRLKKPPKEVIENSMSPFDSPMKNTKKVNFEICKKSIDSEFPWNPDVEPVDILRNANKISLIDIECYEKFLNVKTSTPDRLETEISNKKIVFPKRAICAPPQEYDDRIELLNRKPSQLGPPASKILEALTTSRTNDAFNLERYEILGDSFLKFAASLFLWFEYPKYDEGQLTALKGKVVSNKNLQFCGEIKDLPGRMNVKQFNARSDWLLPAMMLPEYMENLMSKNALQTALYLIDIPREEMVTEVLSENTKNNIDQAFDPSTEPTELHIVEVYLGKQTIQNKDVADCVEALIGVYILDSGLEAGFKILKWLNVLPTKEGDVDIFKREVSTALKDGLTSLKEIDFLLDYNRTDIEQILNYTFNDPTLLLEALSHSSNVRNRVTQCYQRLEFIGDAILDFLITTHIYEKHSSLSPGGITDLRSALVNNITFACMVVRLGLHKFMLTANTTLDNAVNKFVAFQTKRNHLIDETVLFLLEEECCTIASFVEVPKVLGDIFESLAGAIYLDSGMNLGVVWKVFFGFMHEEIAEFSVEIPKQPTRVLYEHTRASPKFLDSSVLSNGRVMVPLKIVHEGKNRLVHGFGANAKDAKCAAAKIALKVLNA